MFAIENRSYAEQETNSSW